jgi:hypothetical protein
MMCYNGSGVTVQATFDDFIAAEIACALLFDASLRPEEPEAVGLRGWLVQVRGLTPTLAHRAKVVLQSAQASETLIVGEDAERQHCANLLPPEGQVSRSLGIVPQVLSHRSFAEA